MGSILGSSDNPQLKASEPQVRGAHQGGGCHTDRQTEKLGRKQRKRDMTVISWGKSKNLRTVIQKLFILYFLHIPF